MKKKFLSLMLAVVLIFSAIPPICASAQTAWDGTEKAEPILKDGTYQISNGAQLAWFADASKTNGAISAVLTNDIDLGGKEWSPIGQPTSGYVTQAYSGVFDGDGHTISNLSINTSSAFYGLFWCVYGGTVKNVSVTGSVATTGSTAGGIVGKLQGGTIENCSFDGMVTAAKNYVGGIVGQIVTNSKAASNITGCCNNGEINGKYAGGILGYTTAKANISSCYNTGTIIGATRSAGISGQQTSGTISCCYNIGSSASGISGFSNAVITNCYYLDETVTPGGSAAGYEKITDKASLLENLNAGEVKSFTEDTRNKNNGYPVLVWQNKLTPEEEAAEQKKKEDAQKVKKAIEELTIDTSTVKESCSLNLPTQISDCTVEWTSSNTDIISNDGAVTLPDKNIVSIILKAKITCGENSANKDFTIDVWSENIDSDVYLQSALDAMQWNFKQLQPVYGQDTNMLVKFKNLLKEKGFDGITITINSTADEKLVTKTGKIIYPVLDENSYANGRQVKVLFNLSFDGKTAVYPTDDKSSLLIPWDTGSVKEALEKSVDTALAESIIANGSTSLEAVSGNLNLPSNIGRNEGKYSFAWVTWESSDSNYISVSDEKRQGSADALYNPYVGKVYQDEQEHTVTLSAAIKNPSTDVTIKKSFSITILPLSNEELSQTIDKMNAILSCYKADKLTDSSTKKLLDINAVSNDIQLVIPKNVVTADELAKLDYGKYWDYWNYKFSAESSDTDVIEINSFRAYVYRPLGEDSSADKQVTLTIKMESKSNPNLFVTKDITVTVKHLSREDINAQLDLMDRAKENYANGLLGENSDAYSIIDNLSPYKEIVWNSDKTDVDFVYAHSDIKGNGIIVDTLPNWEEQEDWRLFRTSDKDLISNETLILNKAPSENTFVKISSVLTDEALGKYYNKFKNVKDFDAEALAKFKQLYKQPVSAYVMAVGADSYTESFALMSADIKLQTYSAGLSSFKNELDKPISVTFTLLGLDGETMIGKTAENSFTKGATVFDVFKKIIADNDMYYTSKGSYVSSINGLSEKKHGGSSGWMYSVDGVFVNSYMNAQELNGGEDIIVMYVRDYKDANKKSDDSSNSSSGNTKPDDNNNSNSQSSGNQIGSAKPNTSQSGNNAVIKPNTSDSASNNTAKDSTKSEADLKPEEKADNEQTDDTHQGNSDSNKNNGNSADNGKDAITDEGNNNIETDKPNMKIIISSIIGAILVVFIIMLFVIKRRKK